MMRQCDFCHGNGGFDAFLEGGSITYSERCEECAGKGEVPACDKCGVLVDEQEGEMCSDCFVAEEEAAC